MGVTPRKGGSILRRILQHMAVARPLVTREPHTRSYLIAGHYNVGILCVYIYMSIYRNSHVKTAGSPGFLLACGPRYPAPPPMCPRRRWCADRRGGRRPRRRRSSRRQRRPRLPPGQESKGTKGNHRNMGWENPVFGETKGRESLFWGGFFRGNQRNMPILRGDFLS